MESRVLSILMAKLGTAQISKNVNHGNEKLCVISFLWYILKSLKFPDSLDHNRINYEDYEFFTPTLYTRLIESVKT